MSDMIYMVRGDHSTFARPDKSFEDKKDANDFADYLRNIGYENVTVDTQEKEND